MIALHEVPAAKLADDRGVGLPAHSISPEDAQAVLEEIANEHGRPFGRIEDAFDPRIQSIVDNWPVAVDGSRAEALGLPRPPALKKIIEEYLEDFGTPAVSIV